MSFRWDQGKLNRGHTKSYRNRSPEANLKICTLEMFPILSTKSIPNRKIRIHTDRRSFHSQNLTAKNKS